VRKVVPLLTIVAASLVVLLGLLALRQSGWGSASREASNVAAGGEASRVIIVSPHSLAIEKEFKRAFEAWHLARFGNRCEVEWQDHGGTSDAVRFIKSEFVASPNGIGVDIFWGGGMEPYLQFDELGLLQPIRLPEATLSALPPSVAGVPLYNAAHTWYGTAISGFGIIWNRKRIAGLAQPEPKTWADLAEQGFFGEVAAADPRASGTALAILEVILQAYGWEKGFGILTRLSGNVKTFAIGAGDIPKLVSMGEAATGLAIDFYAWIQIRQDGKDKIGFVLPEGLTAFTPDGFGILKGAPHAKSAQRFAQFVMSPEGQALWVLPKGFPGGPVEYELLRIPVLPGVYKEYAAVTNVMFDPSAARASFHYDPAKAAARRDALKDLYGAIFVDLSTDLAAAWRAVIRRGLKPAEVKALCAPPMSEEELTNLSMTQWSNANTRNRILTEWTNLALERYKSLAR